MLSLSLLLLLLLFPFCISLIYLYLLSVPLLMKLERGLRVLWFRNEQVGALLLPGVIGSLPSASAKEGTLEQPGKAASSKSHLTLFHFVDSSDSREKRTDRLRAKCLLQLHLCEARGLRVGETTRRILLKRRCCLSEDVSQTSDSASRRVSVSCLLRRRCQSVFGFHAVSVQKNCETS